MRVEIDTEDLVQLVRQFLSRQIDEDILLEDIEEMVEYGMEDFKHEVTVI